MAEFVVEREGGYSIEDSPSFRDLAGNPKAVNGRFEFGDGTAIQLEAMALTIPGLPLPPWRHPSSLEPVSLQQLLAPASLQEPLSVMDSPVLNFLFRAEGPEGFPAHAESALAFDGRTYARIGGRSWDATWFEERALGNWTLLSIPIGIWHDTPVSIAFEWLHGEPSRNQLTKKDDVWSIKANEVSARFGPSESIDANELLKYENSPDWLGWLGADEKEDIVGHGLIFNAKRNEIATWFPRRAPNVDITPTEASVWYTDRLPVELSHEPTSVSLIHLPSVSWHCIEIPAMPDMPNGRDVENLFEVKIPSVTTRHPSMVAARAAELDHVFRGSHRWAAITDEVATIVVDNGRIESVGGNWVYRFPRQQFTEISAWRLLDAPFNNRRSNYTVEAVNSKLVSWDADPGLWERLKAWWENLAP